MTSGDLNGVLLAASLVLLAAVLAVRLSTRTGLPSLLIYLGIGLGIGESGLGLEFENADLTQILGFVALAIILAEGGFTTRWHDIRPVLPQSLLLASLGVAVSVSVTAAVAYAALDVNLRTAVLLGAVVSSTDAAAVFSVLRRLPIRHRLRATLEAESGFNDPPVIILVTLVTSDAWDQAHPLMAAGLMLYQLVAGGIIGVFTARTGQWMLARIALPAAGLYPLATIAIALLGFALAGVAGASPFLAVYCAGLLLGNAKLPHRASTAGFVEGLAWLAQIGLFVLLGLLASPTRLPQAVLPALIVGSGLLLLARPLSVVVCALPLRVPMREQVFMSWAGLRGAVPIVLATIPITADMPAAARVFDVVFVLVVVFTLIQGPTLPMAARLLGVIDPDASREVTIESAPLEELRGTFLQTTVSGNSRLAGVTVTELGLPTEAAVTLILRDGAPFVPNEQTVIRRDDHLLIVTTDEVRPEAERRILAVARAGRLARWRGEYGDPQTPGP